VERGIVRLHTRCRRSLDVATRRAERRVLLVWKPFSRGDRIRTCDLLHPMRPDRCQVARLAHTCAERDIQSFGCPAARVQPGPCADVLKVRCRTTIQRNATCDNEGAIPRWARNGRRRRQWRTGAGVADIFAAMYDWARPPWQPGQPKHLTGRIRPQHDQRRERHRERPKADTVSTRTAR
jgi:hypothetical protein